MSEFLTTKELADLLRIKERRVYDLAASGDVPCSRATGKLLFPRAAVMEWLDVDQGSGTRARASRPLVFLGSHDPLLDWAIRDSRCGLATSFDSSEEGLARFESDEGIATGLHLFDPAGKGWNVAEVSDRFKAAPVVLVRWSIRQRGLVFSRQLSHSVKQMTDVRGLRLVPRQEGAGAQRLLDLLLRDACVEPDEVVFTEPASSEADAALAIREGRADATLGLATVAFQYDLAFQPIVDEAFDLLVDRRSWFEPPFQALIEFAGTARFRERAAAFPGYEIGTCGKVLFNGL